MKNAYVVEMSVLPGGARRGNLLVCSKPEHVRQILAWELTSDPLQAAFAADLALFYGETLGVWTIQDGTAVAFLDLHPFLRARIDGAPPIALDDGSAIEALAKQREEAGKGFVEEAEFDIDWRGIERALPILEGDIAQPGDTVVVTAGHELVADSHLGVVDALAWGWNDTEGGDEAPAGFPELT